MKLRIEIDCSTAAFGQDHETRTTEVARLLGELIVRLVRRNTMMEDAPPILLWDSNGIRAGKVTFSDKERV